MTESYRELYSNLRESEFACVPSGFHDTEDVYELVKDEYPGLCDDNIRCRDVCGTNSIQPEWKHRVRTVQQDLRREPLSRVKRLNGEWYYGPKEVEVTTIPDEKPAFEAGKFYNRWELHDVWGGQRYSGIATPKDHPLIFVFTGGAGDDYGYEDIFLPNGTFLYTGEGIKGDMQMDGGNKAIRDHKDESKSLFLFEDTEFPWVVTHVGQFEYAGHQWKQLPDENDEQRDAIHFLLKPVTGTEVPIQESPSSLTKTELFNKAKQTTNTPDDSGKPVRSKTARSYSRSEVIKEFALRVAEGICQGCGEKAPFHDKTGDPFLEVHHLYRRSDGGADDPENVVALCPNCHQRVHHGEDGDQFNRRLIEKVQERNNRLRV